MKSYAYVMALVVLLLSTLLTDRAEATLAIESWCDGNPNCICSATMDAPFASYATQGGTDWAVGYPGMTKPCGIQGQAPGFVELSSGQAFGDTYTTASSGEAIDALPAGHTLTHVLRFVENGSSFSIGNYFASSGVPTARRAMRVYKYYSTGYTWTNLSEGGSCANSNKIAQLMMLSGGGPIFTEMGSVWSFYSADTAGGWTPAEASNCCGTPAPGAETTPPDPTTFRGKWIRFEIVMENATTVGHTRLLVYLKNVTDNQPEIRIIDTDVPTSYVNGEAWTSAIATGLRQTGVHPGFVLDVFRNGDCPGWAAFSHYAAAAWSSNAGQRIGAAVEVEGGVGGGTTQTLTVTATGGTGTGIVTSNPSGINCPSSCSVAFTTDSQVSLTATPASGSAFIGWSGACSGSGACSVTMTAARSVTAQFNLSGSSGSTGIALNYVLDSGIGADPAVIFSENFEDALATIKARFNGWDGAPNETVISADVPAVSGGVQSMLFQPADDSISSALYRNLGDDYDTLYMRYYVKYSGTDYHHSGGMMGGYFPATDWPQGDAGYKGVREDGTSKLIVAAIEVDDATDSRLDTYNNFVGMQGTDFLGLWFGREYLGSYQIPILAGQWQCVEFMVKVNTTSGNSDGELAVWINGNPIVHFRPGFPTGTYDAVSGNWTTGNGSAFPGLQWRDTTSYALNWIKLQNYDTDGSPTAMRVDDLVVATSYIGPINTGNTGPTARTNGVSGTVRSRGKVRFSQ